jgi:Holliday junction resolvase RusA-like endonuclease
VIYLLNVPGIPRPQPRPRFVKGRVVSTADANARRWISSVVRVAAETARVKGKAEGPLSVCLGFTFPTRDAKRWGLPHLHRPDADNLAKLVLDAAMKAGLIADDATVSCLAIRKTWGRVGEEGLAMTLGPDRRVLLPAPPNDRPDWL